MQAQSHIPRTYHIELDKLTGSDQASDTSTGDAERSKALARSIFMDNYFVLKTGATSDGAGHLSSCTGVHVAMDNH
ncbi:hypothetical protein N7457_007155 [Penicillium paradoxum]|uniref:uncharacterized protein n=1 Tax=Penicillium paradoxum TaxID=176176 RepID=UPI0025482983|nr:uncharacterized protein N7457_007155 [Penicillium paradoxum]KAJ5779435.1 hypothetical protein N7457_007155 [Penicillium paradoxum]